VTPLFFKLLFVIYEVNRLSDYKFLKVEYLGRNSVAVCDFAAGDINLDEGLSICVLRTSHDEDIRCSCLEYFRSINVALPVQRSLEH